MLRIDRPLSFSYHWKCLNMIDVRIVLISRFVSDRTRWDSASTIWWQFCWQFPEKQNAGGRSGDARAGAVGTPVPTQGGLLLGLLSLLGLLPWMRNPGYCRLPRQPEGQCSCSPLSWTSDASCNEANWGSKKLWFALTYSCWQPVMTRTKVENFLIRSNSPAKLSWWGWWRYVYVLEIESEGDG